MRVLVQGGFSYKETSRTRRVLELSENLDSENLDSENLDSEDLDSENLDSYFSDCISEESHFSD